MRSRVRLLSRLVSALVPPLTLICSVTYVSAQSMPSSGPFGFLVNTSTFMRPNNNGTAVLGVINLDGAGGVTGSYTFEQGSSQNAGKTALNVAGSLTGTYSMNPDGTGSITVNLDAGLALTFALVIDSGGQSLRLVETNCFFGGQGCNNFAAMTSGYARSAPAGSINGSYAVQLISSPNPNGTIGVMNFDGAGNVTLSFTSVAPGKDDTTGQMPVISGNLTGTYSTNPDGSGTIHLNGAIGQMGNSAFAFVVTDGGSGLLLMLTDGTASDVWYGSARQQ